MSRVVAAVVPAGTGAALRLYAALPSLRGNFMLLIAVLALGGAALTIPSTLTLIHKSGVEAALFSRKALNVWWMGSFYAAAGISSVYWGRVGSNVAPMVPTMLAAEWAAATIVLLAMEALLAAPLFALGARPANALALACVASFGGLGFGRGTVETGQSQGRKGTQALMYLPLLFVGMFDDVLRAVGTAPMWAAGLLVIALLYSAITSLQYRPAQARLASERSDRMRASVATPTTRPAPPPGLMRALDWRPAPLRDQPLPPGPLNPGTLGLTVMTTIFLLGGVALAWLISMTTRKAGAESHFPAMMGSAAALPVLGASAWLMSRGEWTRTFVAGRYGSRRQFARALVVAHLWRTLHLSVITAVVVAVLLLMLHAGPIGTVTVHAITLGVLLFGACQLGLLLAMVTGLSKLWIGAAGFGGMMAANLGGSILLKDGWPLYGCVALVAGVGIAVIAILTRGPAGLQRTDWTPEESDG